MTVKADWVTSDQYTAAAANAVGAAINTLGARVVTPEDFGAVGDGSTDCTAALNEMFNDYTVANGGSCILIPYGKVYSTDAIDIKSNTYVFGGGTLKMRTDDGGAGTPGVFLTFKNVVENVTWVGPTLDVNSKLDVNGFDIGQDSPAPTEFKASNIYIAATVKGARIKTAMEDSNNNLFSGGGKAIAVGSASRNVYANIRALDCDIGGAFECTSGGTDDLVENVVIDLQTNDCHRCALYINGALPDDGASSLESARYAYSVYNGVKIRLRAQSGNDGAVTNTTTGAVNLNNYDEVGIITMNYACGVDVDAYIATPNRATLVRGMATASRFRINALMDDMQDGWDTRPCTTHTAPGTYMSDNVFEANIHAATHRGVLVRPHREGGTRSMIKTKLDVNAWCQNNVGAITQSDGTTDGFGSSVNYRFCDMRGDPVKEVTGISSINAVPAWALAASGGHTAAANVSANNLIPAKASTPTAAAITTLSVSSPQVQEFTGSTTQTVKLPTTGVTAGQSWTVVDNSTNTVTVQSSGANTITTVTTGTLKVFVAQIDTPTAAAHWRAI